MSSPDEDDDIEIPDIDDAGHIDDDDGGIESDGDICEKCEHPRDMHEDDKGACGACNCKKFKG
jgi:hypothetical protein